MRKLFLDVADKYSCHTYYKLQSSSIILNQQNYWIFSFHEKLSLKRLKFADVTIWVLSKLKKLFTFVMSLNDSYILWKCFSQVLVGKCGSFQSTKDWTDNTHSCLDYAMGILRTHVVISIRVWDFVSFVSYQVFPQPSSRHTDQVSHFLCG